MIIYKYIMGFIIFALIFCATSHLVVAEEAKNKKVTEQVDYSRAIPTVLRAYIPEDRKSRFLGESKLKYKNCPVWIHLYDVNKINFSDELKGSGYGSQRSRLDLFISDKHRNIKRISSTSFFYSRYGGKQHFFPLETMGVNILWLDLKSKKRPIVQLDIRDPNGLLGPSRQVVTFVFEKGLTNPIIQQQGVGYGVSKSDEMNCWETSFVNSNCLSKNLKFSKWSKSSFVKSQIHVN